MKLESSDSAEEKRRWKIIRTDFYGPNGGEIDDEILAADEETGEYTIKIGEETKTVTLGAGGIRIVGRRR